MNLAISALEKTTFDQLPVGTEFAFRNNSIIGGMTKKRNVFIKIEPFTASAPNAKSETAPKLKLWFQPSAPVFIPKREEMAVETLDKIAV